MGGGKDTAADYLVEKYGYNKIAFADALKDVCKLLRNSRISAAYFKMIDYFNGIEPFNTFEKLEEFANYPIEKGKDRKLMQDLGTFWARAYCPNVWINAVKQNMVEPMTISDCRFLSEFHSFPDDIRIYIEADQAVRAERILIRDGYYDPNAELHPAEQEIELLKPLAEFTVDNNGTKEELYQQIEDILDYIGR